MNACAMCGREFKPTHRRDQRFCSKSCASSQPFKRGPKRRITIDPVTGCHNAECRVNKQGYPVYKRGGRRHTAARIVWEEAYGPIPEGLQIDHLCRNPRCVNIEHLEVVTCAENIRRSPRVKLTVETAAEIKGSDEPGHVLAKRYGVSQGTISLVRHGKVWVAA